MANVSVTKKTTTQTSEEEDLHDQMGHLPPRTALPGPELARRCKETESVRGRQTLEAGSFCLLLSPTRTCKRGYQNVDQIQQKFSAEENL